MKSAHPALDWLILCTCISSVSSPQCSAQLHPGLTGVSLSTSVGLFALISLLWWQPGTVWSPVPRLSPLKDKGDSRCSLCCDKLECLQCHKRSIFLLSFFYKHCQLANFEMLLELSRLCEKRLLYVSLIPRRRELCIQKRSPTRAAGSCTPFQITALNGLTTQLTRHHGFAISAGENLFPIPPKKCSVR